MAGRLFAASTLLNIVKASSTFVLLAAFLANCLLYRVRFSFNIPAGGSFVTLLYAAGAISSCADPQIKQGLSRAEHTAGLRPLLFTFSLLRVWVYRRCRIRNAFSAYRRAANGKPPKPLPPCVGCRIAPRAD